MANMDNTMATIGGFADLMNAKGLTKIAFRDGDFELELEMATPAGVGAPIPMQGFTTVAPAPQLQASEAPKGTLVKSPIVGTYYNAAAPDRPPFVTVGKKVKKGDVLMIIESMKLMNEITSDVDGTVAEILVPNGSTVEFDQGIMRIE